MSEQTNIFDLFCIELPKNTTIYKGVSKSHKFDYKFKDPVWFTTNLESAEKYAKKKEDDGKVLTFKTSKKLKLINITSNLFRLHYLDQVNLKYPISLKPDDTDSQREKLLVPIGLPSQDVQKRIVDKTTKKKFCPFDDETTKTVGYLTSFTGFHRYSETKSDLDMAKFMKETYPKIDGYIQPSLITTCWHGTFQNELCLFDVSMSLFPIKGGGVSDKTILEILNENSDMVEIWDNRESLSQEEINKMDRERKAAEKPFYTVEQNGSGKVAYIKTDERIKNDGKMYCVYKKAGSKYIKKKQSNGKYTYKKIK